MSIFPNPLSQALWDVQTQTGIKPKLAPCCRSGMELTAKVGFRDHLEGSTHRLNAVCRCRKIRIEKSFEPDLDLSASYHSLKDILIDWNRTVNAIERPKKHLKKAYTKRIMLTRGNKILNKKRRDLRICQ